MALPTPVSLARLFAQLIGREVTFVQTKIALEAKIPQVYGVYKILPDEILILVKADLPLLGSFAGALMGLPDSVVKGYLSATPMNEPLRDAIYEVLNVASSAIAPERRIALSKVVMDKASLDEAASSTLAKPNQSYYFNVSVNGYQGGKFSIFAQSAAAPNATT
jgi:hypothetical protein